MQTSTLCAVEYGGMKTCDVHNMPKVQRMRGHQRSGWYCKGCAADRMHAYRRSAPDAVLDSKLWTFYRIRLVDFRAKLAEQGGRCAACRAEPTKGTGVDGCGLVIDHDHGCCPRPKGKDNFVRTCGGCIRGLICPGCNVAAGMAGDDPARLRAIADYLERVT